MERAEYHRMAALEDTLWWYRALHGILTSQLNTTNIAPGANLLDAGCGTGGLLRRIVAARPDLVLFGVDIDPEAAGIAADKSGAAITISSISDLPYRDMCFDVAISADVLSQAAVDPRTALAELRRCLKSSGMLLLNLPAYQWMLSAHDRHVHNVRRYTAREARQLAIACGFRVVKAVYWNSLLFPLMCLYRLTAGRQQTSSDVRAISALQESLFFCIITAEQKLARHGFHLPFGGSIFIEARKP